MDLNSAAKVDRRITMAFPLQTDIVAPPADCRRSSHVQPQTLLCPIGVISLAPFYKSRGWAPVKSSNKVRAGAGLRVLLPRIDAIWRGRWHDMFGGRVNRITSSQRPKHAFEMSRRRSKPAVSPRSSGRGTLRDLLSR